MEYVIERDNNYLEHHGIKGQKWGVRRYQNKDGSLTNAGRKRLYKDTKKLAEYEKIITPGNVKRNSELRAKIVRTTMSGPAAKDENFRKAVRLREKALKSNTQEDRDEYIKKSDKYAMKVAQNLLKEYADVPVRTLKNNTTRKSKDYLAEILSRSAGDLAEINLDEPDFDD